MFAGTEDLEDVSSETTGAESAVLEAQVDVLAAWEELLLYCGSSDEAAAAAAD